MIPTKRATSSLKSSSMDRTQVVEYLEKKTKDLFNLLYNTDVPIEALDAEVLPYIHENVGFKDPWQEGRGKGGYREGMRGFHCQFYFDCDLFQVGHRDRSHRIASRAVASHGFNSDGGPRALKLDRIPSLRPEIFSHLCLGSDAVLECSDAQRGHDQGQSHL